MQFTWNITVSWEKKNKKKIKELGAWAILKQALTNIKMKDL